MTDTSTPPAGWYPAPDGSSAPWWWDGERWTQPQSHPRSPGDAVHAPVPSQQQPATTKGIARLASATQVLLVVCGAGSVATIGVEAFGISVMTGFLDGQHASIGLLDLYDRSLFLVSALSVLSLVAAAVLWAIWQYRAAKHVSGHTRRGPGWHAASWFVPIINLWFPYQNVSDLWRAVGRSRPTWQIAWWLLWLVGSYVNQISGRIYDRAEGLELLRVASWFGLAGEVLLLAAVPLAWLIVRGITQDIVERFKVSAGSSPA